MVTVIDTDAMLALINPKDALHKKAKAILVALFQENSHFLVLPTTLSEFAQVAANKVGLLRTRSVLEVWVEGANNELLPIDDTLSFEAIKKFSEQTSREESLFDCFVMAAAKKYKADCIFSFDKGYRKAKNDFKLASDLLSCEMLD